MPVINSCTFVGHLGSDPEKRYSAEGRPIINFRMAVSNRIKDRETQEWVDDSMWMRVTVFGQNGERRTDGLHKGSMVYVRGRMETPKIYHGERGDSITINLIADEVQGLDPRERSDDGEYDARDEQRPTQIRQPAATAAAAPQRRPAPPPQDDAADLEDLPF